MLLAVYTVAGGEEFIDGFGKSGGGAGICTAWGSTTRQFALTLKCVSSRLKWQPHLVQKPAADGSADFLLRKAE